MKLQPFKLLDKHFVKSIDFAIFALDSEPIYDFKLKLNGNKKNERNEMYRKRLVDEVSHLITALIYTVPFI